MAAATAAAVGSANGGGGERASKIVKKIYIIYYMYMYVCHVDGFGSTVMFKATFNAAFCPYRWEVPWFEIMFLCGVL